ncbi:MAG: DUF177 domain-containing protein [Rhodothermaceae bacterium]
MSSCAMEIKFNNFADGIHHFEFVEKASEMELGEEFIEDVLVNCKMDKSNSQIVLSCELQVKADLECDRCTENYLTELTNNFEIVYLLSESEKNEESDDLSVHYISPDADKISIKDEVTDFALLAVPFKKLCDESCKGLCTSCGTDLNKEDCNCDKDTTNPVWEPLMKLKDKLN